MAGGKTNLRSDPTSESEAADASISSFSNSTVLPDSADADRTGFNRLRQAMDKVERLEQVGEEDGAHHPDWADDPSLPPFMQDALSPSVLDTSLEEELAASLVAKGSPENRDLPPQQEPDPLQQLEKACSEAVCPDSGGELAEDVRDGHRDVSGRLAELHGREQPKPTRHETVHRQHASTSILSIFAWVALPAAVAGPLLIAKPQSVDPAAPLTIVDEALAKRAKHAPKLAMASGRFLESGSPAGEVARSSITEEPETAALRQQASETDPSGLSRAQLRKTGRLDAAPPAKRRDPVQVASAVNAVPALLELSPERRADLQSRLEGGECLSSALPEVLGHVPVLAMRDMIRLLEGDCL